MPFASVSINPLLFRAALYEHLLGPEKDRVSLGAPVAPSGLPTYRAGGVNPFAKTVAPKPPGVPVVPVVTQPGARGSLPGKFARYERVGASPSLYDVTLIHSEEPANLADHRGRVVISNILSSNEIGFGRAGDYRLRLTTYAAQDADAAALLWHVARLVRMAGSRSYPMRGQCYDSLLDISRNGPEHQPGSGLWRGTLDFQVKLITTSRSG